MNSLLSHGFKFETIADVCWAGLARAQLETVRAGGRAVEIACIRITDAGRADIEFNWASATTAYSKATLASRHVAEGKARANQVRAAMARRRALGSSTDLAETLLNTMLVTLSLKIEHKAEIEAALDHQNTGEVYLLR
ncbi:MAG TPA: hypothetical protein VKP67_01000 [Xanthobacteraceae bacterium]|nr:hypothetical protein [Xanthobacteraceae bacterium]